MSNRLVEWDSLDLRLSGSRLQAIAESLLQRVGAPVQELQLSFRDGELRVSGKARKAVAIPFQLAVRRIHAVGRTITFSLEDMSAFGFLPLPAFLMRLVGNRVTDEGVTFNAEKNVVVVRLDRFLPTFVDVEVTEIHIIDGGIAVRLGRGGADMPVPSGGDSWNAVAT